VDWIYMAVIMLQGPDDRVAETGSRVLLNLVADISACWQSLLEEYH
jgi:hypothetical protein